MTVTSMNSKLVLKSVTIVCVRNDKYVIEVKADLPLGKSMIAQLDTPIPVSNDLKLHVDMFLQALRNHLEKENLDHG